MMKLFVERTHKEAELEMLKGTHSPIKCSLVHGAFRAFQKNDAEPLVVCLRRVLSLNECGALKKVLWHAATSSDRRGPAAGPLVKIYPSCVRVNDFAMRKVKSDWSSQYNKAVLSGTIGYNKFGKATAWTQNNPDKVAEVIKYFKKVQRAYRDALPQAEKAQTEAASRLPNLGGTPFRTAFVNRNFRTALHRDCNVDRSQYGILLVLESGGGGHIQFPEIETEINLRPGDLVLFRPNMWHCNTPLNSGSNRFTMVLHA